MGILRTAVICLFGYIFFAIFRFIIGLMLPSLTLEFRLTPVEAGAFASASMLSTVLTISLAGYTGDRLGRKLALAIGMLILWIGALMSSLSPNYLLALIFIFVAGAGAGFLPPTTYSIMGELRPQSRASMIGITASIYNFGGFVGSLILGVTIAFSGWRINLGALAILGLIYVPMMLLYMNSTLRGQKSKVESKPSGSSYLILIKSRSTVIAGASMFMGVYAQFVIMAWTPTYLIRAGIDPAFTGALIGTYALAGGVSAIISGRIADAWGEKRLILSTGLIAGVISLPLYLYHLSLISAIILMLLLGFLHFPYWNLVLSMVQRLVDSNMVGTLTGMVQNIGIVGGVVGPTLAGFLIQYYGFKLGMITSVTVPLLLYALLIIPYRGMPRKMP